MIKNFNSFLNENNTETINEVSQEVTNNLFNENLEELTKKAKYLSKQLIVYDRKRLDENEKNLEKKILSGYIPNETHLYGNPYDHDNLTREYIIEQLGLIAYIFRSIGNEDHTFYKGETLDVWRKQIMDALR